MTAPQASPPAAPITGIDEVRAVLGAAAVNGFACIEIDRYRATFERGIGEDRLQLFVRFRDAGYLWSAQLLGVWNDLREDRDRIDHPGEHPFDFIDRLIQSAEHVRIAAQTCTITDGQLLAHGNTTVRSLHSQRTRKPR